MYQPENFVKFDSSLDECVFSLSTRIVPSFLSVRTCAGRSFGWTLTLYLIQLDEMVKKKQVSSLYHGFSQQITENVSNEIAAVG